MAFSSLQFVSRLVLVFGLWLGLFGGGRLLAQQPGVAGNKLLRNLPYGETGQLGKINAMLPLPDGRIALGSSEGIFLFDGSFADGRLVRIETPSEVYSLALTDAGVLFAGCARSQAVYVTVDSAGQGRQVARSLPGLETYKQYLGTVEQLFVEKGGTVILLGKRHLLRYDPTSQKLTPLVDPQDVAFAGGFVHTTGEVYVNVGAVLEAKGALKQRGLYKLSGTRLVYARSGERLAWDSGLLDNVTIRFGVPYKGTRGSQVTLIGTAGGWLYLFSEQNIAGLSGNLIRIQNNSTADQLRRTGISSAVQVSADTLAIGTGAGVWLVTPHGNYPELQRFNTASGLPSNQVSALLLDANRGLWAAHSDGLSRISLEMPITDLTVYEGLTGSPTAIYEHALTGQLYIGTTTGVFRSKAARGAQVRTKEELARKALADAKTQYEDEEAQRRLAKRNQSKERNPTEYARELQKVQRESSTEKLKAIRELQATILRDISAQGFQSLSYERVEGINGVCLQLLPGLGQLVAVTTTGTYRVDLAGGGSKLINARIPKRAFLLEDDSLLVIAVDNGVELLKYHEKRGRRRGEVTYDWPDANDPKTEARGRISGLTEPIVGVAYEKVGDSGVLWLTGYATQAIRVREVDAFLNHAQITDKDRFVLFENYEREIGLQNLRGRAVFVSRVGAKYFDHAQQKFVDFASLGRFFGTTRALGSAANLHFAADESNENVVWVARGNQLYRMRYAARSLDNRVQIDSFPVTQAFRSPILAVQPNPRDTSSVWLIVENKLYALHTGARVQLVPKPFKARIHRVEATYSDKRQESSYTPEQFPLAFTTSFSSKLEKLTFYLSATNFSVDGGLRFHYRIVGAKNYSDWIPVTEGAAFVEVLNSGIGTDRKLTFELQAIDAFGNVSETASYGFKLPKTFFEAYWRELLTFLLVLVLAGGGAFIWWQRRRNTLREQKLAADKAFYRRSTRELLDNILPPRIARRLEDAIDEALEANPENFSIETIETPPLEAFERVSLLFTDFKGFSAVAETLPAHELSELLNENFLEFDRITKRNRLEKIKTIGDAYMAAGGIPDANATNPVDTVLAGLQLQRYMRGWVHQRKAAGQKYWECRVGINTGDLRAGIIGKYKFAYDCWGDTVNTASRMESHGEAGKVNISGATYALVAEFFDCQYRGALSVKGKEETVDQYFVEGIRPGLHQPDDPAEPNEAFWQKVAQVFPAPASTPQPATADSKRGVLPKSFGLGRKNSPPVLGNAKG
ncbi:MAG: adenylate/guanylate cyclase domain-containing protein [Bacteroidia bacterium]|nr:adenylate/guanylate cyclase domain-containing protein [Bacteroidia bacterium]